MPCVECVVCRGTQRGQRKAYCGSWLFLTPCRFWGWSSSNHAWRQGFTHWTTSLALACYAFHKKHSSWADLWQPDGPNPTSYLLLSSRRWPWGVCHLHWRLLPAPNACQPPCLPSCCVSTGVVKAPRLYLLSCSSSILEDMELLLQLRWSKPLKTQCELKRPKTGACYTDLTQLQPQCQSRLQNLSGFPLLTDPRPASEELSHGTNQKKHQNWELRIWMFTTFPSK